MKCPHCGKQIDGAKAATLERRDTRLLDTIRRLPGTAWQLIRDASGLTGAAATIARDRLVASKKIVARKPPRGERGIRYYIQE